MPTCSWEGCGEIAYVMIADDWYCNEHAHRVIMDRQREKYLEVDEGE